MNLKHSTVLPHLVSCLKSLFLNLFKIKIHKLIPLSNVLLQEIPPWNLILDNGTGYAAWMNTATLPPSRIVDTAAAFTTWVNPTLAVLHGAAIRDALTDRRPESADLLASNFAARETDLLDLDDRLEAAVARSPERPVLFSHPVYDYLIARYGISGYTVEWEPDQEPGRDAWRTLEDLARDLGIEVMIWEAEPLASTADGLRARGVESLPTPIWSGRSASGFV